jgi:hypothetical protein
VDYSTAVEIQELGIHKKPVLSATTRSLSIGGILVESHSSLDNGAKIQINIALDSTNPLLIIGTVIRSDKMESGNYETSIAFLDSDKVIRNEISSYLIKHLKDLPSESPGASQNPS